ncbi:hypothetical protein FXO37_31001 [Capsicum annuum]|nr:hypothetical protein FXO37_31001 [Capsicum annuum]
MRVLASLNKVRATLLIAKHKVREFQSVIADKFLCNAIIFKCLVDIFIMQVRSLPSFSYLITKLLLHLRWWAKEVLKCPSLIRHVVLKQVEFDSVYFACIDYQDRVKHKKDKSLEVIWRGLRTFGSFSQEDGAFLSFNAPLIFDINVGKQVNDFINATITQFKSCLVRFGVEQKNFTQKMKRLISQEGEMIKIEKLKSKAEISTTAKESLLRLTEPSFPPCCPKDDASW